MPMTLAAQWLYEPQQIMLNEQIYYQLTNMPDRQREGLM